MPPSSSKLKLSLYSFVAFKIYHYIKKAAFTFCLLLLLSCTREKPADAIDAIEIEVMGDEFNWYFTYPGMDGVLGTSDDQRSVRDLYLPDKAAVSLTLKSKDYVYSFALPDLQLREIAVPGLEFQLHFNTHEAQTLRLLGDQFCGFSHKTLIGKVYIRNQKHGYYGW